MALNNANNSSSKAISLGSPSASEIVPGLYFPRRSAIKSVALINGAAMSGSTNSAVVKLQNNNGGSPVDLASIDTSVTPVLADQAAMLTSLVAPQAGTQGGLPPSTGYPLDVPAGSTLEVSIAITGAGALTNAQLSIDSYEL